MSIQIYGFWRSIASFRVRVALKLKGLPFEELPVDILAGEQFRPGYEAVNAEHVVPTFVHDGQTLFQSLAIMEYLEDLLSLDCCRWTPGSGPMRARSRLRQLRTPIR